MDSSSNIYCKIELLKKGIHSLHLNIHLNPEAPNIKKEQTSITWNPTIEEQDFLIDVLSLIDQHKKNKHITFSTKSQKETNESIESQIDHTINQKNNRSYTGEKNVDIHKKQLENIIT